MKHIIIIFLFVTSIAMAEEKESDKFTLDILSLELKFGVINSLRTSSGFEPHLLIIGGGLSVKAYKNNYIYSVGANRFSEFCFIFCDNILESTTIYNFSFGKLYDYKRLRMQFLSGISYSTSIFRGEEIPGTGGWFSSPDHQIHQYQTFGIPLELGVGFKITNGSYLGVHLISDINKYNSLYVPMLSFSVYRNNTSLRGRKE